MHVPRGDHRAARARPAACGREARGQSLEEGGVFWTVIGIMEGREGRSTGHQLSIRGPESTG